MLLCNQIVISRKETSNNPTISTKRLSVYHKYLSNFSDKPPITGTKALSRVSRRPYLRASFTVEAAFIFPMLLFLLLVFMGFFTALQVQGEMTEALQYTARKLAMQSGAAAAGADGSDTDESDADESDASDLAGLLTDTVLLTRAKSMTVRYLENNGCWTEWIDGGTGAISFSSSSADGDYVYLCADYTILLPISFWGIGELPVTQAVSSRKWIGSSTENAAEDDDVWVYVTATGSAYHTSLGCSYLDLSIQSVSLSEVSDLRNQNGGKYYACSCVEEEGGEPDTVYITDYGTEYHASLSCSALKRTVYKIRLSEAGGYHACSKCGS